MLSAVSLVLALLFFALGAAQRTIWAPPDTFVQEVSEPVSTPVLVLDSSVMNQHEGSETLEIEHSGPITVIIARTHDLIGWIGGSGYTLASGAEGSTVELEAMPGEEPLPADLSSDLWQELHEGEGELSLPMDLPNGTSIAIIGDGESAAPSAVRVVWPNVATYPLFGPFMTAGFVLLAFSLLFLVLGLRNHRRKRGPQRATAQSLTRRERRAIAKGKAPAIVPPAAANTAAEPPAIEAGAASDSVPDSPPEAPESTSEGEDRAQ